MKIVLELFQLPPAVLETVLYTSIFHPLAHYKSLLYLSRFLDLNSQFSGQDLGTATLVKNRLFVFVRKLTTFYSNFSIFVAI